MTYCIGVDVSKQSLKLWDGRHEEEVPNERGLTTLKKLLKKWYGTEWNKEARFIYEPTGPYSNYLYAVAAEHEVKVYEVNPKKSANFAKVLGTDRRQMPLMPRCCIPSMPCSQKKTSGSLRWMRVWNSSEHTWGVMR